MDPALLANMTPEQLAVTPAGYPPPGVVSNLANPSSQGWMFYAVGSVMMAFMLTFAGLRYYTKLFIWRKTSADDWTTLIAIIGTICYFIACTFSIEKGRFGTHIWDLSIAHLMDEDLIVTGFWTNWVTAIVWAFAKTSFFIMYLNLFKPLRWLRWMIYLGLGVNWAFYIAIIIVTLYLTAPAPGQTWQESFTSPRYAKSYGTTIPIAVGSLALDLYIFIIPMIAIGSLQLSTQKKFGAAIVFATGLATCAASSMSVYYKHQLNMQATDFTYSVLPVLLLALVEMCVGVACSCMPPCAHFFKIDHIRWKSMSGSFSRLLSKIHTTTSRSRSTADEDNDAGEKLPMWRARHPSQSNSQRSFAAPVEHDVWANKMYTVQTTAQSVPGSGHMEQDRIYVDRTFSSQRQE